jgi:hypothetical protein
MTATATLVAHCGTSKVTRDFLKTIPLPEATRTHQPISHYDLVEALIESLDFRQITVVNDEYAVTPDGMKMFGLLELNHGFTGCRFAIGIRNSNDKSFRLAMTVGLKVVVCDNMAFKGDFQPVLAKHSKKLNLIDLVSVGVDRIQRNFEPLQRMVTDWQKCVVDDTDARLIIYEAFIEKKLPTKLKLVNEVHKHWFNPPHEAFREKTLWSLLNAFTEAFKSLKPVHQFQAAAKLSPFIQSHYRPF